MKHEQVGDLIHNAILDAQRYFLNPICLILISVGKKDLNTDKFRIQRILWITLGIKSGISSGSVELCHK